MSEEPSKAVGECEMYLDRTWYWVKYEAINDVFIETPAMYQANCDCWYSFEFSGVPTRQVEVLEKCSRLAEQAQEIERLNGELSACTEHPGGCGYWREAARNARAELEQLKSRQSSVGNELINRAFDVVEGLHGEDLPGSMVARVRKLKAELDRFNSSAVSAGEQSNKADHSEHDLDMVSQPNSAVDLNKRERLSIEIDIYRATLRNVLKDIRDDLARGGLPLSWNGIAETISCVLRNDGAAFTSAVPSHSEHVWEGFALVPIERSYEMRTAAFLHYNTAKKEGKDHDEALDAAWRATLAKAHGPYGVITTPSPTSQKGSDV